MLILRFYKLDPGVCSQWMLFVSTSVATAGLAASGFAIMIAIPQSFAFLHTFFLQFMRSSASEPLWSL